MFLVRRVSGDSMLPGIRSGQLVVAVIKKPKVGSVVIAAVRGRDVVKRVTGIKDSRVYLVGDNLASSTDSRTYGLIGLKSVLGVVVWPLDNTKL